MVQFTSIRDLAQKELSDHLDKYAGTKVLVWDEGLTGPMDLLAKYHFFKERSVVKMFSLKGGRLPQISTDNIVFITRPGLDQMDKIADNVKGEELASGTGVRVDFHVLFVQHKTLLCEMRLKDRGVFGTFTYLDELAVNWFPLDSDVISMERPGLFADYHLRQDPTCLHEMARAMMSLQALYGFAPVVYGKGSAAKKLFDFMSRMKREMVSEEPEMTPQIDTIIILDRQVDLISPLITQLTYEGLIDEMYGIRNASVKLPGDKFTSPADSSEGLTGSGAGGAAAESQKQFVLNSNEELYSELRDKNFNAVGPTLSRKARAISTAFEGRHGAKTVQEFKSFVDKLPQMQSLKQSLATHTSIAELIKEKTDTSSFLEFLQVEQELVNNQNVHRALDFIEDAACQQVNLARLLRIACLQSVINNGLKAKTLEAYRKVLLQAYGHVHLTSLINLERAGLLCVNNSTSATGGSSYAVLRKRLNLTQDDVNELEPNDITYVHSVYAPLSVRLIQNCAKPGWRAIRDVLDLLPGPSFDEYQQQSKRKTRTTNDGGLKRTLVVFVGGCTYAEISALRFLSQQEDSTVEYLVATTSIINGSSFIEGLMAKITDPMAF